MKSFKTEDGADLLFSFPDDLDFAQLDRQGVKLPVNMKFVDLIIERPGDILLIEVKDPSHCRSPENERRRYFKGLLDNSVLTQDLTPKARDSYAYLHLMERDTKPFIYIVLIGLDAFDSREQKAVLSGFKDRLLANIRKESFEAWKRKHIADCVVLSVPDWNRQFPQWLIVRLSGREADE